MSNYRDQGPGIRDRSRLRSTLVLIVLAAVVPSLVPGPRSPVPESLVWSDPVPIAEAAAAVPPVLVALQDGLQIFWVDGSGPRTRLLRASVPRSGRPSASEVIAGAVDVRAGWPVAAAAGNRIAVVWMGIVPGGYALTAAVVDGGGAVVRMATVGPPAEQPGRVAVVPEGEGWAVAWSQYTDPTRRIWFVRLDASGRPAAPARAVADGDGAALAPGTQLFWWAPVGFDTYRLTMSEIGARLRPRALTGTISLPLVIPPIPLRTGETVEVLLPIVERGFATAGRLYVLRAGRSGAAERVAVTPQPAIDVAAARRGGDTLVAWSSVAGRRRNSEIFALLFNGRPAVDPGPSRVSFTTEGSSRPALAPLAEGWAAAWLEVAGDGRFRVVLSTATVGHAPGFLLGIPELDPRHPGRLLSFAAAVIASVLLYAGLYTAAMLLPTFVLIVLAGAVVGSFGLARIVRHRSWLRCLLVLAVVTGIELTARTLIPGPPTGPVVVLLMAGVASIAVPLASLVNARSGELGFWVVIVGAVFVQITAMLFPWGAQSLTQF